MNDEIQVNWEVEDGYVGKSRPRMTNIYPEDFDPDMTELEIEHLVWDIVDSDFRETIAVDINNMDEVVEQVQAALAQKDSDA